MDSRKWRIGGGQVMTVDFRFSEQELYELWAVFRDNPDAVQMLSDLVGRGDNRE